MPDTNADLRSLIFNFIYLFKSHFKLKLIYFWLQILLWQTVLSEPNGGTQGIFL